MRRKGETIAAQVDGERVGWTSNFGGYGRSFRAVTPRDHEGQIGSDLAQRPGSPHADGPGASNEKDWVD
jgi:hypothetical protein